MDDDDLAASVFVKNKNNVWIGDNMATSCYECRRVFNLMVRRHHCRNCGNVYCYKCCSQYIQIPSFVTDRPDPADYWNVSYYVTALRGAKERVCSDCFHIIQDKTKAYEAIVRLFENPPAINVIKELPDSSADVKTHYFDHLRNIQYYLPNHVYNDVDKKLLKINEKNFAGHSKYLMHLIKSIDWQTTSELDNIIWLLSAPKTVSCNDLYCTRTCQEGFSCDDCVCILYNTVDHIPDVLLQHLFDTILLTPEQIILCHLTFFVKLIKNNSRNKLLIDSVYALLSTSEKVMYHTYWFLLNARETATPQETTNINAFLDLYPGVALAQMHIEYMFYVGLINNLTDPETYLRTVFEQYKPISLPYDPTIKLLDVDLEQISVKSSYTKPVVIPFETNVGRINLLFKKESIINDVLVLNLMTLCDIILSENLNDETVNIGLTIYPTMPLTANSGMIQIIDNAETVHAISNKRKTIFQYIMAHNEDKLVSDIMDRYMFSLVSYTLHSYFIGLGDRHLQNIMITHDGSIFHIDFGFILGTDAYSLTTSDAIKLNSDMLDAIGGRDSKRYELYLELCAAGITVLRKYFNMFFVLLVTSDKFRTRHIEKFVLSRFQARQSDRIVIAELMAIIKNSHNAYADTIRDFLHYHTQERTVQHSVGSAIKSAFGMMRSFTTGS